MSKLVIVESPAKAKTIKKLVCLKTKNKFRKAAANLVQIKKAAGKAM